jgi:serine/threonine-protein kinase
VCGVGVTLFELLGGRSPFVGRSIVQMMAAVQFDAPRSLRALRPEVPPALEQVVLCCLEKDPARRFQSMRAFAAALFQPWRSAAAVADHF